MHAAQCSSIWYVAIIPGPKRNPYGIFYLYVTGFIFYIPYRIFEKSSMPGSIMVVAKFWAKRALLTHPTNLGSKWECTLHMMHGVNGWHMAACMFAHCDWWFHLCIYRCQTSSWLKADYYFVACVVLIAFEFDILCVNVFGPSATQQEAITFPV